jgi:hypothetical protein
VQNTARTLEVRAGDTFAIYAIAYGFQPVLFYPTSANLNSFTTSLVPEQYVDTTLNATTRNTIAATIAANFDGTGKLVVTFDTSLAQYSPGDTLNGFQYFTVINGSNIALGAILGGTLDGFEIIDGGFQIGSPAFYAQVNNSVTTVGAAGFSVPLYVEVLPAFYIADPTYTPTRKNTSGIVLQTAPWTQQTASISETDKAGIATEVWTDPSGTKVVANTGLIPGLF